jgi:hypothetical protein
VFRRLWIEDEPRYTTAMYRYLDRGQIVKERRDCYSSPLALYRFSALIIASMYAQPMPV